jgi:hypothetical protein
MPFLLTYSTQSAWLTDAGVPLATIGLLSELSRASHSGLAGAFALPRGERGARAH